jgi:hypothetical protein
VTAARLFGYARAMPDPTKPRPRKSFIDRRNTCNGSDKGIADGLSLGGLPL